jgi:hypothetical protein
MGHEPRFDIDFERWYIDVHIDADQVPEPFIRLGLVRFQKHTRRELQVSSRSPSGFRLCRNAPSAYRSRHPTRVRGEQNSRWKSIRPRAMRAPLLSSRREANVQPHPAMRRSWARICCGKINCKAAARPKRTLTRYRRNFCRDRCRTEQFGVL